jgi:hypothetical protein
MLKKIAVLCLSGLSIFQLHANEIRTDKETIKNGRYQISTSGGDQSHTEIYLLDTQNGNIWMTYWSFTDYKSWRQLPPIPTQIDNE